MLVLIKSTSFHSELVDGAHCCNQRNSQGLRWDKPSNLRTTTRVEEYRARNSDIHITHYPEQVVCNNGTQYRKLMLNGISPKHIHWGI